jgi:hypothetical protein
MKTQNRLLKKKSMWRCLRKYYRGIRLYMKRVIDTEREIGGELHAC